MKTLSQIQSEMTDLDGQMAPLKSKQAELSKLHFDAVQREAPYARWRTHETSPEGVEVLTKIDDSKGVRNVCTLKRQGNLWFYPDGSMYVYYTPTHWRP